MNYCRFRSCAPILGHDAEERALEPAEAEDLLAWLFKGDQQTLERQWLLNEWQQQWRPAGPEPDEIEKFLR